MNQMGSIVGVFDFCVFKSTGGIEMDSSNPIIKSELLRLRQSDSFKHLQRRSMSGYLGWYFSKVKDDKGEVTIVAHQRGDLKVKLEEQGLINQYAYDLCLQAAKLLLV